jgi:VWFA-related protein
MFFKFLVTGGVLAVAVTALAQEQTPAPSFVSQLNVNNVTVDVQVRDSNGVPVQSLGRGDFRVLEDEKEQALTNFLSVTGGEVDGAGDAALVGQPAARQVIVFFDLYLMIEPNKRTIVEGLLDRFGEGVPPALTVGVVSFDGTLRVHTAPTSSRERIVNALKEVSRTPATGLQRQTHLSTYDTGEMPRRESWTSYEYRRHHNTEYWDELRRMVSRVESAFTATVQRFSATDARKVVVLVSPGFPRAENVPMYKDYDFFFDVPNEYRNVGLYGKAAMLASELEFTLYTLDASGNQNLDAHNDAVSRYSANFNDVADAKFWREADRKDNLIKAAKLTGGEAIFTSDSSAAFADVERLTATYYSLGYQPDHAGDGKTHAIKVEVIGHPDYVLTHRTSYVDRPFEQREAERSRAALLTGEGGNPLGILLALDKPKGSFNFSAKGMKTFTVAAELRIPYAHLVMIPRGDVAWGQVQVVVVGVDPSGNQSELTHQKLPIQLPADKLEEARERGYYAYRFSLQLEGGATSVRIAVDDVLAHDSTSTVVADLKL